VRAFSDLISRGRLAHAYLFSGPDGIGKSLFAGELARALLCTDRPAGRLEACDHCPSCRLMEAGNHPDFFAFRRPEDKVEFPVELALELCQSLALKPARGNHKIVILEDADDLNEESSNTLLKTLEEPPPGSLLIVIVTAPERLLPTIVSRCQVVRFHPLPARTVEAILEQHEVGETAQRPRLARMSGGSPGRALELADPALWKFRTTLLEGLASPRPDTVDLSRQWTEFLDETGKDAATQRGRASLIVGMLIDFFHDALRLGVGGTPTLTEPTDERLLRQFSERVDVDRCLKILERCFDAHFHIDRRVQLVLAVEALVHALTDGDAGGMTARKLN
jgi:DNA polymerase-3 subunit delta'